MAVFSMASSLVVLLVVLLNGLYILHALPSCGSAPGVSTELIHPESPLYDPTSTPSSRSGTAAFHRSAPLTNGFRNPNSNNSRRLAPPDINSIYLDGLGYKGWLLLKLVLGTPVRTALIIVSTTARFGWVMCSPCQTCGKYEGELFNPSASSTYETVPCESSNCESIRRFLCLDGRTPCTYEVPYIMDLTASGFLSKETVQFRRKGSSIDEVVNVPKVIFGCTHRISGDNPNNKTLATGYIGLKDDKLSLINQLHYAKGIPRKFSFCIPLEGNFSRIYFGNTPPAVGITSTARLFIGQFNGLYYVHLRKIEVRFLGSVDAAEQEKAPYSRIDGNIIINSATDITFIDDDEMKRVSHKILDGIPKKRVSVPEGYRHVLDLCFDWKKPKWNVLPVIRFHLSDNGVISGREAYVVVEKGVLCLFIASAKHSNGVQFIGSGVMRGHRFEIDLEEQVVNIEAGHSGHCRER